MTFIHLGPRVAFGVVTGHVWWGCCRTWAIATTSPGSASNALICWCWAGSNRTLRDHLPATGICCWRSLPATEGSCQTIARLSRNYREPSFQVFERHCVVKRNMVLESLWRKLRPRPGGDPHWHPELRPFAFGKPMTATQFVVRTRWGPGGSCDLVALLLDRCLSLSRSRGSGDQFPRTDG